LGGCATGERTAAPASFTPTVLRSSPIAIIPGGMVVGAIVDVVIVGAIDVGGVVGT
jgi:hypothetical protein